MTHIRELADLARARISRYVGCSNEQALTYACEDVVIDVLGSRAMSMDDMSTWLDDVCESEDVDVPVLVPLSQRSRLAGSADVATNVMCVRGDNPTAAVALHELAHISAGALNHDRLFRTQLVGLWRRHLSVEHAALLYALFGQMELDVDAWN